MSFNSRSTSKGGKGARADKSHKSDKTDTGKGSLEKQKDKIFKHEDSNIDDKVKHLMEMTQKSEDEVVLVLYQCDYDMTDAVEQLLEGTATSEWETRVKKKKSRQASSGKQGDSKGGEDGSAVDNWHEGGIGGQTADGAGGGGNNRGDKDKPRGGGNRSGGPPRLHGRGWRGRERHENDRNAEEGGRSDFQRDRDRRGRSGGDSTRGRGGRGRGGGRTGGRYPPRGNRGNSGGYKPIETWENSNTWDNSTAATTNNPIESWDDFPGADEWSTEEYTGSLADTKVFTPSAQPILDQIKEPPGGEATVDGLQPSIGQPLGPSLQPAPVQMPSQSPVPALVGSLTPAQTQYFSQLQQNNDTLNKQYGSTTQTFQNQTYEKAPSASQFSNSNAVQSFNNAQYVNQNSNYVNTTYQTVSSSYGQVPSEQSTTQPPTRTKTQRARVPPPSKIPASAVEMPGDLNSSIGYLDVQFGAMDLIDTNSSFDATIDNTKYNSAPASSLETASTTSTGNLDLSSSNQNSNLDVYSPKAITQSSISSALSQSLSSDNIPPTSEHLSNAYNSASRSTTQGNGSTSGTTGPSSGLDLNKPSEAHSYSQPSSYNTYQSKASTYNSSTYSGTQTTSSYVSNQANAYVNNQSGNYNTPSANSYQNAYSSNNSYQSSANSASFPSISQSNTYPSNNQSYQQSTNQSVYGTNPGLNSGSSYGNASQYNNYASSTKLVKDSYETSPSTSSTSQVTTTHVTSSALTLSQTTVGSSKTSTTLAKSSNSIVSNIPPGVAPVMSTPYIMGQMQYFQQPVYSYEDMQMLQQRIPHMTTPFYDMSYQTPTTLATVRDAAALGNVGYSLSDGRFTRTDNNSSPVPSTLSQQTSTLTQGHQAQPILAAGTAPPYFFATAFNTIAPNYQFGMYTQLPAATNAHGSSNSTQYPKPAAYGSGYGSYDALNQSQDYTKSGYVGNTQAQKGAGANASSTGSSSELAALYSKPHTALGKVNSYEKQAFHSGTPPPFTGAIHGSQNAGLAPSGTGYAPQVYIPTMAAQHHSTHLMQQPLHQMDVRHQGRRADSGNSGSQRTQASNQAKASAKQPYQASYWNQA